MQYVRGDDKKSHIVFREPKTAKSRRLIALSPSTVITLREHKLKEAELRLSLGMLHYQKVNWYFVIMTEDLYCQTLLLMPG